MADPSKNITGLSVIRPITDSDAPDVVSLLVETWTSTYSRVPGSAFLQPLIADIDRNGLAAMMSEGAVGLLRSQDGVTQGCVFFGERGSTAYLWGLYVRPDCQRRGAGRDLLSKVIDGITGAKTIEMQVLETSSSARAFYSAQGFADMGQSAVDETMVDWPPTLHFRGDVAALKFGSNVIG